MINLLDARRILDRTILYEMVNMGCQFGRYETFYPLDAIANPPLMPRELVRTICRDLTDRGFARYQRGLFREEGVGGAGYGITPRGLAYYAALEEAYER